jgi:membrane-associated phospholipid phosphatase
VIALIPALRAAGEKDEARFAPTPGGDLTMALAIGTALAVGLALYVAAGYPAGFATLNGIAAVLPGWFWQGVTLLGETPTAFALGLIVARRHPLALWVLVLASLPGALLSRGIKHLADMDRPPAVLAADTFNLVGPALKHSSFPSGHTITAFLVAGVVAYVSPRWRVPVLALALFVGLSRVAVGVHWPLDVVAGAVFGLVAAWLGIHLGARWRSGASPRVHLVLVAAFLWGPVALLVDDWGYPGSAWVRVPVALAAVVAVAWGYVIEPLRSARASGHTAQS